MTPSPLWILWAYLAGIPLWWAVAARYLGVQCAAIREWSVQRSKKTYPSLNRDLDPEFDGWSRFMLIAVGLFFGAGLWPVFLPCAAFFMRGHNVAKARKLINKRLKEAEAEIERIRRQEGWTK